jgi:hypothetical protein
MACKLNTIKRQGHMTLHADYVRRCGEISFDDSALCGQAETEHIRSGITKWCEIVRNRAAKLNKIPPSGTMQLGSLQLDPAARPHLTARRYALRLR